MEQRPTVPSSAGRRQTKAVGRRYRGVRHPKKAPAKPERSSASVWARIRYRFDNALSRGAWVVIGYLGLITLVIVIGAALLAVIGRFAGFNGGSGPLRPLEAFWQMLVRVIDSGSFAGDTTPLTRLLALLVTLAGIFIAGSLIGG